ncbi:hypothetical protein SAMN05216466_113210 [Paraburkholderia phenazinium]|uniref:Lipoprotein n=1 Tax=Paraburkholderia phenazinium TaxID=60549 RepID=A0A1G8FJA2_9BURK|nr:hypothetical protein SAMN05216466_113210 [Paraburkholderia phenazinium]
MKPTNLLCMLSASLLLSSCAYQATLMPRDSGKVYTGILEGNGMGSGTMTVMIDSRKYQGPVARVSSNETFGFASAYGTGPHGTSTGFGTAYTEGDATAKALMSSEDGHGLRCDLVGRGGTGGGICVDDGGRVYDVVLIRK